jgi:hypothetical protein
VLGYTLQTGTVATKTDGAASDRWRTNALHRRPRSSRGTCGLVTEYLNAFRLFMLFLSEATSVAWAKGHQNAS